MTDYRARTMAALRDKILTALNVPDVRLLLEDEMGVYEVDRERAADVAANAAVDVVLALARDATREVSEELARLKLADADRAARDLLGPRPSVLVVDYPDPRPNPPVRSAPDATSTPTPVPASDDARQGDGEAHRGSQGVDGFAVGDTVERLQPNGSPWYRGEVVRVHDGGLDVAVSANVSGESWDSSYPSLGDEVGAAFTAFGKPCWRKVGGSQGSGGKA